MRVFSQISAEPTVERSRWSRWLRASRKSFLTLLTVVGVGAALFVVRGNLALAQNTKAATAKVTKTALQGKIDHLALSKTIDQLIKAEIVQNGVQVSPDCTDAEFVRRAYLDIIGVIPTAENVQSFLASSDPHKRAKLIDELLDNPRYGKFFAELWTKDMVPEVSNNRRLQNQPLEDWLTAKFNENTPWNKVVHDIVAAEGPQNKNGAVTFYIGNPAPEKITNQVTKLFLGVQLQCAQCHDHPFTDYKQDEYWGMAAFFTNVTMSGNPNQAAKNGFSIVVDEATSQKGAKGKRRRVRKFRLPPDAKRVPAKFLQDEQPSLNKSEPMRPVVAEWMTSKDNPYFARAAVNKMWYHFFGRGIVNPYNDMHGDNPASHPELLATLEEQFKQNDFDLKYLIRAICNSQTYQRSSRPVGNNTDDRELFSHALVRSLAPEQLYDSISQVLGSSEANAKTKRKNNRRNRFNVRDRFIDFFTQDDGYKPLEYQAGIPQALMLMNSRQLGNSARAVKNAMKEGKSPADVISYLYLSTVSRVPTSEELQRLTQYVGNQANPQTAYSDVLWALLNSSEFALNH